MFSQQKIKATAIDANFDKVLSATKLILKEFDLCDDCTGRLFAKKLGWLSHKLLGKKIKNLLQLKSSPTCYICKNILSNLQTYVEKLGELSSDYQFSSFLVGAVLKSSTSDKDDIIRSKFKLRGIDSIKTTVTHQIAKKFARKTKTKVDYLNPDLTFTINFKKDSCELRARPLLFYGRYTKKTRGLTQKQTPCSYCKGRGCFLCNYYGISKFDSVEGRVVKFLHGKFGGTPTKMTWIGGEDKNSLVLGRGRPFFVKLSNPKLRKIKLDKRYVQGEIVIHNLRIIEKIPKESLPFRSKIQLSILTKNEIKPNNLKLLKRLKKEPILIFEKPNKRTAKNIYEIRYKKASSTSFSLWITADGGLPIKRFVEGGNVRPNLSEILENKCVCKEFDFQEIELIN